MPNPLHHKGFSAAINVRTSKHANWFREDLTGYCHR
jgi:hypothetical protein